MRPRMSPHPREIVFFREHLTLSNVRTTFGSIAYFGSSAIHYRDIWIDNVLRERYLAANFEPAECGLIPNSNSVTIESSWAQRLKGNSNRPITYWVAKAIMLLPGVVITDSVTFLVPSRETRAIYFGKVSKAGVMVMTFRDGLSPHNFQHS